MRDAAPPTRPWIGHMVWTDLAFLHWPVPVAALRPLIPALLQIDEFDGVAWIGVVPFRMQQVRLRFAPPVPTTHEFPELNVRTYVRAAGRAGVWFFSLDAASWLAVRGARWCCHLPYFDAEMSVAAASEVVYHSRRTHRGASPAEFHGSYQPAGMAFEPARGTLEHFLVERYCLFTTDRRGRLLQLDVDHDPWRLQPGVAEIDVNTMVAAAGIALPERPPLVHVGAPLAVTAWLPRAR